MEWSLPTDAEIHDMPAVILVGARDSGKSRTLAGWTTLTQVFEVNRPSEGPLAFSRVTMAGPTPFRSREVKEYIVGDGPGQQLRIIDLPGEALDTHQARKAENVPTAPDQFLIDLQRLDPLLAGVIICSAAPTGDESGHVSDFDRAKVEMLEHPPNWGDVQERLTGALRLTRTFLMSPNVRRLKKHHLEVAVQVNFADIINWGKTGAGPLKKCFDSLLSEVAPGFDHAAVQHRLNAYAWLDDWTRHLLPWLDGILGREYRALHPFVFAQANDPSAQLFGDWSRLLGFIYLFDQTLGRKKLQRRRTTLVRNVGIAVVVLILLARLGIWYWRSTAPESLPLGLAASACQDPKYVGPGRCGCAAVLMKVDAGRGDDFRSRLRALGAFAEACKGRTDLPKDPLLPTALLHAALAAPFESPDAYDPTRIEAALKLRATPGGGPLSAPWYPAVTESQAAVMRWLLAVATNHPDREKVPTLEATDAKVFPDLARRLSDAAAARSCLDVWRDARGTGRAANGWAAEARRVCAPVANLLPETVRTCLAADMLSPEEVGERGERGQSKKVAPRARSDFSWPETVNCKREDPCRADGTLGPALFPTPKPNARIFAALAFLAPDLDKGRLCLGRADGLRKVDSAASSWLSLFSQGPHDRLAAAAAIGSDDIKTMRTFLDKCKWSKSPSGALCDVFGSGDNVLVPLRHVDDALCALAGVPGVFGPNTLEFPWHEPVGFSPLDADSLQVQRAELAFALAKKLASSGGGQPGGCPLVARLTRLRAVAPEARAKVWQDFDSGVPRSPKKNDPLAARFLALHCEAKARLGQPEEGLNDAKALTNLKLPSEARRCAVTVALMALERGLSTDPLLAEDGTLGEEMAAKLRELRESCADDGTPCKPSPEIVAELRKLLEAQGMPTEFAVLRKQEEPAQ